MSPVRPAPLDARVASVLTVAEDVFAAMVDGEPGHLSPLTVARRTAPDPLHAWVDIAGEVPVRVVLSAGRRTAGLLARELAGFAPDEEVSESEVADAFGEVANMLGGNLKGMQPPGSSLGLPRVAAVPPPGKISFEVALDWRGHEIIVSVLTPTSG
ncbi:chemotaxis protein CheX [Georgenia yuyongxinii]|uniref:Chemotaxis protein CheX n=1 Tax=Georgenia yuyongxinii TaxID=2589797 RepID=A0A552WRP5_9MICO|nr:chemotaxis protein CheX [Georgenia yuyongxinii]TRW45387.1 chemotaxis protein CheX [Georgenia yuyongxinii]